MSESPLLTRLGACGLVAVLLFNPAAAGSVALASSPQGKIRGELVPSAPVWQAMAPVTLSGPAKAQRFPTEQCGFAPLGRALFTRRGLGWAAGLAAVVFYLSHPWTLLQAQGRAGPAAPDLAVPTPGSGDARLEKLLPAL